MNYVVPKLPYAYDALEPSIDARTMELHHTKHHQAYCDGLNAALAKHPELENTTLDALLSNLEQVPADIRTAIRNQGGGFLNHSLFWLWMQPKGGGIAKGTIGDAIVQRFGSFEAFQKSFAAAAQSQFGSGWAWLVLNQAGNLDIMATANQDAPISSGCAPLLGVDVWEHAYYLAYQNRRAEYLTAWWNVVNWSYVDELYRAA